METNHTQGKWSIFQQDEDIHIENECSSEAIATLVGWNNDKVGLSNAKLIASAPEILEMLQEVVNRLKGNGFPSLQSQIEELIKKATE